MIEVKAILHQFLLQAEESGVKSLREAFAKYGDIIPEDSRSSITKELVRCNLMHSIHPYESNKYRIKDIPLPKAILYLGRFK